MILSAPSAFREIFSTTLLRTFLIVAVVWFVKWLWSRRKLYTLSFKLPGPLALPFLGNAVQILDFGNTREKVDLISEWKKTYGSLLRVWFGPELAIVITSPEDFECILMSKETSWKGSKYEVLKGFVGDGLLTLSGSTWKSHRHLINPAFSVKATRHHGPIFNHYARTTIQSLEKFCDKGVIDFVPFIGRYAADSVSRIIFGLDLKFYNGEIDFILNISAERNLIDHERICKVWLLPDFVFKHSSAGKRYFKMRDDYTKFFYSILEAKSQKFMNSRSADEQASNGYDEPETDKRGTHQNAFDIMMGAVASGELSFQGLFEEFNNIFNAGLDSVYSQLCAFFLMIAMHKECQDRLWQEIRDNLGDDPEGDVSADVFSKLPYLDMALKESIRIFPTGPILMRHIHRDFYLKSRDITLPAGTTAILCTLATLKDPSIWKDPESFIPERFLPEEIAKRPYFAYIPFSAGPRNCVGQAFAVDAMKILAIQLIRNFEFHSDLKPKDFRTSADVSIRSAHGYHIQITKRKINSSK